MENEIKDDDADDIDLDPPDLIGKKKNKKMEKNLRMIGIILYINLHMKVKKKK